MVLDAGLLPRRAYAAGLIGQALVAAALGSGHRRIACDLAVPAGTVRGWIRGARRSAAQLRVTAIRTVVAYDQDALPARVARTSWAARWNTWGPRQVSWGADSGCSTPVSGRGSTC